MRIRYFSLYRAIIFFVSAIPSAICMLGFRDEAAVIKSMAYYIAGLAIHTFFHEVGHLVGGYLTNYRLLIFHIGNISVRRTESMRLQLSLTNDFYSQCVMIPRQNDNVRYMLYISGGIIVNSVLCVVCILLYAFSSKHVRIFLVLIVISGLYKILINALPVYHESHISDGAALYLLGKGGQDIRYDYMMYLKLYEIKLIGLPFCEKDYDYDRNLEKTNNELIFYMNIQKLLTQ